MVWYITGHDDAEGQFLRDGRDASIDKFNHKADEMEKCNDVAWKARLYDSDGNIVKEKENSKTLEALAPNSDIMISDWVRAPFHCSSCDWLDDTAEFVMDWSKDVDHELLELAKEHKEHWSLIASCLRGRNEDQCKERYTFLKQEKAEYPQGGAQSILTGRITCKQCTKEHTDISLADFKMDAWRFSHIPPLAFYQIQTSASSKQCKEHTCRQWNFEEGFCNEHRSTLLEIKTVMLS